MIARFFKTIVQSIWSLFLNGLFTLLPITITISVFSFSFKLIKGWLSPLQRLYSNIPLLQKIPHAEVVLAVCAIFILGIILKSFLLRSIFDVFEMLLARVPLVRPVYTGVKQLVHAFSPTDTFTFKKVVFIEFPRKGLYSLGFLTSELSSNIAPHKQQKFFSVFVPTTPNPTTGYFVALQQEDFTPTELTTQEAMALIISGGIIQPKSNQ